MDAATSWSIRRGIATFLGLFFLLNVAGGLLRQGFDANVWLLDLRVLPEPLSLLAVTWCGSILIFYAARPPCSGYRRKTVFITLAAAATLAMINALIVLCLIIRGVITTDFPLPFSILVAAAMMYVAWPLVRPREAGSLVIRPVWLLATVLGCAIFFPLAQMYCFGLTDYRRPAEAVVVFGAQVHADGEPSQALADRVVTACQLYKQGEAPLLIFSGGPGEGNVSEPRAMQVLAESLGVPAKAILLDSHGVTTAATVKDTLPMLRQLRARRVLAVSHFYHLPRIKLAYSRAGLDVLTVPATESQLMGGLPKFMEREIVADWLYYLDPLLPARIRSRS